MSRIEEAFKKAKELSSAQLPASKISSPPEELASPRHAHHHFLSVGEEIEITSPRLVAVNNCNLPITEEYKKLKSNVVRRIREEKLSRRILVTSALSGEGKSVTALNLAISLAQDYDCAVTLIDTDLRNPSLCRYLGLERKAGLADCLADGIAVETVLLATGMGNLTLLAAGRRVDNPVELLSSAKMESLLVRLSELIPHGYVVFDSCPLLPFAEPRVIASLSDSAVFVVKEGGTSMENFHESMVILGTTNVLGVVYNKATYLGLAGGYQYYYYDYANHGKGRGDDRDNAGILSGLFRKLSRKKSGDAQNV